MRPFAIFFRPILVGALWAGLFCSTAQAATTLVSSGTVPTPGTPSNRASYNGFLSADGKKVAFDSEADNLVAGDTNGLKDVFVRDLSTGVTTRVSVGSNGTQSRGGSYGPCMSADGAKVAFTSLGDNLVSGDTNEVSDIFVHDLTTGITTRVNVSSSGAQADSGFVGGYSLSVDGTKIAFDSGAANLVSGDTNNRGDIFVRDLTARTTTRVSLTSDGTQTNWECSAAQISGDGKRVAFQSKADDLVSGDTNSRYDVFMRDLVTGVTSRVSVDSNGAQVEGDSTGPSISADGTKVAFETFATNPAGGQNSGSYEWNMFVRDLTTGVTSCVNLDSSGATTGHAIIVGPNLSADGTKVAFASISDKLVPGDTNGTYDIFVRDLTTGIIRRVIADAHNSLEDGYLFYPSLSRDGKKVAFMSNSSNLVSGDINGLADIFVSDVSSTAPFIGVSDPRSIPEGSVAVPGSTTFAISLTEASLQSVMVIYKTTDNTAKAASDYLAKSGTLTFAPGETTKYVRVDFVGDAVAEANETLFFDLKTPANATIADSRGVAYIRNDDGPSLAIANAVTVDEGNSGTTAQSFKVTLSSASTNTVTVNWSTANNTAGPADYVVANGTLSFAPGETTKTITILVKGDTIIEPTETYKVNLSSPTFAVLADSQGVGYIRNDDTSALNFEQEAPSE